jgi:hypothetical protein
MNVAMLSEAFSIQSGLKQGDVLQPPSEYTIRKAHGIKKGWELK